MYKTEPNEPMSPITEDSTRKGLTKREYFAVNAPNEIPEWFIHSFDKEPGRPTPIGFQFGKYSNHPQKDLFCQYWNDEADMWEDKNGEVPESLKTELAIHFQLWNKYNEDVRAWELNNKIVRYFQWQTFYADQLINALNAPTP